MFKSVVALAVLLAGVSGAQAAEVGIRHESGSSHRTITHGRSVHNYRGQNQFNENTVSGVSQLQADNFRATGINVDLEADADAGSGLEVDLEVVSAERRNGNARRNGNVTAAGDLTLRSARTVRTESGSTNFDGSETYNFAGGSSNTFSESSVFAR